jgi:hypothetical protein
MDSEKSGLMKFYGLIIFLIQDKYGCIHFHKKKSKQPAILEQYLEYIKLLQEQFGNKLIKSYVINTEDNKHKYIWSSSLWRTDLNKEISPNHQKYLTYLEENKKDVLFIGPYKSMRTKGLHLCGRGHEWLIQPYKVKEGESCPQCSKKFRESNMAKYITELLISNKIEFIKEVRLTRFGYEQDLRLDFVVCQNNYPLFAIEFNGLQHYKTIRNDFFGGYKGAKERKIRDRNKREHCWNIGLPVVDIPYKETEKQIEETIHYFLRLFELIN